MKIIVAQPSIIVADVEITPQIQSVLTSTNSSALPPSPTNISAGLVSHTYVSLAWTSAATNIAVTGYTVQTISLTDQSADSRFVF